MSEEKKAERNITWKDWLLSCIWGPLLLIQLIHSFFVQNFLGLTVIYVIGWIVWILSIFFGIMPIYMFRKKGGVAKKDSYMKTTILVDTGIYAIVRHGQYLAGILLSLSLILITQHWFNAICGIPIMILVYIEMFRADKDLIKKFGDEYKEYMRKVPRANFLWGIIKLFRRS
jgi:protein-S-isoprenylcysteine O-methyltransferase Ste14